MPPPVEPGDAPINISIISIKSVTGRSAPVSKTLKPAVLGVIDVKRQLDIFSFTLKPDNKF